MLALASLILVCSITACDKQADSSIVEEDSVKTDISNNEIAVRMDAFSVDEYSMAKEQSFSVDISGVTEDMTREQIQEMWGEPNFSGNRSIIYCDGEYEDSYYIDKIIFGFEDTSGKISEISFFVNLDRIEEQKDDRE